MSVCRLCLRTDTQLHAILPQAEFIMSIAAVKISHDDGLTNLICNNCHIKVNDFWKFRLQIENSYRFLSENKVSSSNFDENEVSIDNFSFLRKFPMDKSGSTCSIFDKETYLEENIPNEHFSQCYNILSKDTNIFMHHNDVTSTIIPDTSIFKVLMDSSEKDIKNSLISDVDKDDTNIIFANDNQLNFLDLPININLQEMDKSSHISSKPIIDAPVDSREKIESIESTEQFYIDLHKEYNDMDSSEMLLELQVESRDVYTETDVQEEVAPRISEIITTFSHQPEENDNDQSEKELFTFTKFLCHLCLIEFKKIDLETLKEHSVSHFNKGKIITIANVQHEPPFICEICSQNIGSRHDFIIHQREHLNIKPFVCKICCKSFTQLMKLQKHLAKHTTSEVKQGFPCSYCGKIYNRTSDLQYHEKAHLPVQSVLCTFCDKTFINPKSLKIHQKRHLGNFKHICEYCGKGFFKKTGLQRHEQIHLAIRRYPCHLCEKAFYSNYERRRHLLYHFKTKKFKCSECNKSFYESGHLKIHMRSHTNFRPFVCDICGKDFPTKVKLTRHLKIHNKIHSKSSTKHSKNYSETNLSDFKGDSIELPTKKNVKCLSVHPKMISNILNDLQNSESENDESYIIIEESGEENMNDSSNIDIMALSDNVLFSNSDAHTMYIVDDDELSMLNNYNQDEVLSL